VIAEPLVSQHNSVLQICRGAITATLDIMHCGKWSAHKQLISASQVKLRCH